MNDKVVKGMLGVVGKPNSPMKDSDGDGLGDMIDCQPYNKNKQGFIHDYIEKRRLKKAGVDDSKIEKMQMERKESEAIEKVKTHRIQSEARTQEKRRYYVESEKIKTDSALNRLKQRQSKGGIMGQFVSGFQSPNKPKPMAVNVRPKVRGKVVYEKVGNTFVKRTVKSRSKRPTTKLAKIRKPQSLETFLGGRFKGGF